MYNLYLILKTTKHDVLLVRWLHLGAVWFKKCNANGNGNGLRSITGGNKFE
jgi:hypothetical protein